MQNLQLLLKLEIDLADTMLQNLMRSSMVTTGINPVRQSGRYIRAKC
jgi:hypothetical protein